MPGVDAIGARRGALEGELNSERISVSGCDLFSCLAHVLSPSQLVDSYGSVNVAEVVLESWCNDLIVPITAT